MSDTDEPGEDDFLWEVYWIGTRAEGASGDCIILTWGKLLSTNRADWYVAVIDGGRSFEDRKKMKSVLLTEIGTNQIDYLIGTHTDNDHIGQFPALLVDEELEIVELLMRDAFAHLDAYPEYEEPEPLAMVASLGDYTSIAEVRRPYEPDAGESFGGGALRVLGPTTDFYRELLPDIFDLDDLLEQQEKFGEGALAIESSIPDAIIASARVTPPKARSGSAEAAIAAADWANDQLGTGKKDASNDASLILLFESPDGTQILFTGDAGVRSFDSAQSQLDTHFHPEYLVACQLSHHAAWNNATSALLDKLLGPIVGNQVDAEAKARERKRYCYAMTGSSDQYHPSARVTNAALRRGWHVSATLGSSIRRATPGFKRANTTYTGTASKVSFNPSPSN